MPRPSLLKIGRAEHHINDLNSAIREYLSHRPIRLVTIGNPDADQETHVVKKKTPLPDSLALITGDAIHNLRSALDILMFGMIGERAKRPQSVQFPFSARAETLVTTMKSRETHLAGEKVVAEIEALKPYPGGNDSLFGLYDLDITDKHKLLVPVASTALMSSAAFSELFPMIRGYPNVTHSLVEDVPLTRKFTGSRAERRAHRSYIRAGEYERDVQPMFEICFDVGQPFVRRPLVPVLAELVTLTRQVCEKLASAFVCL